MKSMRREQGFTLIELMIVVAIIAIIAAIAIPSLLNARKAGNEASAISSLARACSRAMSTQCCEAAVIAAATCGAMIDPLSRVAGPTALMIVGTPRLS